MSLREKIEGLPPINGTRIPPECISDRWLAGDSIDALAADYELGRDIIEGAVRDVLRIVAEHEADIKSSAVVIPTLPINASNRSRLI